MRRVRVKPSRPASAIAMVVGLIMVGTGLCMIPMFGPFGIVWTLLAATITVMHGINAFSDHGIASTQIEIEGDDPGPRQPEGLPFDERLRRLQQLRLEGLLTESEFQEKRTELMSEKW